MGCVQRLHGQGVDVSGQILMHPAPGHDSGEKHKTPPSAANVVVWLSPLKPGEMTSAMPARQSS